jgi:hypothetical protein
VSLNCAWSIRGNSTLCGVFVTACRSLLFSEDDAVGLGANVSLWLDYLMFHAAVLPTLVQGHILSVEMSTAVVSKHEGKVAVKASSSQPFPPSAAASRYAK